MMDEGISIRDVYLELERSLNNVKSKNFKRKTHGAPTFEVINKSCCTVQNGSYHYCSMRQD